MSAAPAADYNSRARCKLRTGPYAALVRDRDPLTFAERSESTLDACLVPLSVLGTRSLYMLAKVAVSQVCCGSLTAEMRRTRACATYLRAFALAQDRPRPPRPPEENAAVAATCSGPDSGSGEVTSKLRNPGSAETGGMDPSIGGGHALTVMGGVAPPDTKCGTNIVKRRPWRVVVNE